MIYFNTALINCAIKLLDGKSSHDDIKAGSDLLATQKEISHYNHTHELRAIQLDTKLRQEYPEIELLQKAIDKFPMMPLTSKTPESNELPIISRLKLDRNGIILSVLISHGIIGEAKELIERID